MVLLFMTTVLTAAENPTLTEIRALLGPMRAKPFDGPDSRGAGPAFTEIKRFTGFAMGSRFVHLPDS
jgi:hypothetical protein